MLLSNNIRIVGNLAISGNRIYFVANYIPNSSKWIYCLVDDGSSWNTVSPSYSADYDGSAPIGSQTQSLPDGNIAVSPDGNTIAYFGNVIGPATGFVFYYTNIDNINYTYHSMLVSGLSTGNNSLQFTSNTDLYSISLYDANVHHYKFQEAFCENNILIPGNYP